MSRSTSPVDAPARGDPGDETARRFAYQWTWTAVRACELLDESGDVVEIYCEQHEDILLKHRDGKYTGVQVKTQEQGGNAWKTKDEPIRNSLARFAKLERDFGDQFVAYEIATNHQFFDGSTASTCLTHVLGLGRAADSLDGSDRTLQTVVNRMASDSGCDHECCLRCLKKCRCNHQLPKMGDCMAVLERTLGGCGGLIGDPTSLQLRAAAQAAVDACRRASDRTNEQYLPAYLRGNANAEDQAIIDGKRLNAESFATVLRSGLSGRSLLDGPVGASPETGRIVSRLVQKLARGGLGVNSINAAKDLRDSAMYKSFEWIAKQGKGEGLRRHEHVRRLVQADCGTAQDSATAAPYGVQMREALRQQLRQRASGHGTTVFDCTAEHLEGYAYDLTNECKVWWSEPFEIQEASHGSR